MLSWSLASSLLLATMARGASFGETQMLVSVPGGRAVNPTSNYVDFRQESLWGGGGGGKDSVAMRNALLVAQPFDSEVELVLTNGTADYEHTYTFRPEKGKVISDYSIVPVSSNGDVLTSEDVGVSIVDLGNRNYNVTTLFEFDRATGVTDFTLNFVDTVTQESFAGASTGFTVAGLTFFYTDSSGTRNQVGGERGNLVLNAPDLVANDKVSVESFIQYLDGTNSTEALVVGMDGIVISLAGTDGQIAFDQNSCASDGGTYDGSAVSLATGCGVGFSTNDVDSAYVGPQLGLDFETNRNGSFVIGFDWEDLVVGSDAEIGSAGYETYLNVDIIGEVAPIVTSVTPPGPFSSSGGDTVTVVLENLPGDTTTAASWDYALAIIFGEGDSKPASLTTTSINPATGETTLTYLLPAGTGTDLPWTFVATKPTGETLTGVDGTPDGDYRFSFVDTGPVITELSPDSGETAGGTIVTVTGSFPEFEVNDDGSLITIGTTVIDKSLITSATATEIVFTTPPESSLSGGVNGAYGVTITAKEKTSAPATFTYVKPVPTITSLSPSTGLEAGGTVVTITGSFDSFDMDDDASFITIGTTVIDKGFISSTTATEIILTTPAESTLSGGSDGVYGVTVTADGETSVPGTFTYIGPIEITAISPSSGAIEGGTTVTLSGDFGTFDPASSGSTVTIGAQQIDAADITSSSPTEIVFNTPAQTSLDTTNSVFRFPVVVTVDDQSTNSVEFVYEAPVILTSLSPSSGSEDGGVLVTLTGQFVNYQPSTSGIYLGGKQIDDSLIVSYTDDQIVFTSPAREDIGSLYTYPVSVVIGDLSSDAIDFTYEASNFTIDIDGSGNTFNTETGNYEVGACGNSLYRANIPSSALAQNARFTWSLVDSSNASVLTGTGIKTDTEVFYLPYGILEPTNEVFTLTVAVETNFFTTTSTINLVRLDGQNIGVKILDPDAVSPSDPNTTLTIQADVGVPGCLNTNIELDSEDITYVWVYKGTDTYIFSHLNTTVDESVVGPTLLGREFKIPQEFMGYGTYNLSLTAYYTDNQTISGSDSSTVRVQPVPLVASINAGQTESLVSESTDVAMTASNSRDPDILTGSQNEGLSYTWECQYAWDATLTDALACGESLLSDSSATSFSVTGSTLGELRNTTKVYIQYSLVVRKTSPSASGDIERTSGKVFSTLVLSELEAVKFEPLERIEVYDNLTAPADLARAKYFQDVIITPFASSEETTWSFDLLEPRSASTLLQVAEKLISYPGYWSTSSTSGTDSLGIKANALEPGTEYRFLIRSSRPGFEENEEVLELTTVAQPTVTISGLPISSGTTNDTYIISAFTNYDGDFKFFFTLTDEFGFTSCVDGCQGTSIVRFRLLSAGSYQIRCDVYDSLGYTLLAFQDGDTNITVTSELGEGNSLAVFDNQIETTFVAGDHADFQQLGVDMVKYILAEGSAQSPAEDSETLANYTSNFNQIVANAVPNAEQSAGYVKTAAAMTLLTKDYNVTYTPETLYFLVNITVNAVTRTPDTVALRQLEDLLVFYGTTPELVLAAGREGTTRRRLLQVDDEADPNSQFNVLMADMYEVMKTLIGVVALKPQSCGFVEEIKTPDPVTTQLAQSARQLWASRQGDDDRAKTAAALYNNPKDTALSASRWTVARICNPEQGSQLQLAVDGAEELSQFSWCPELFEDRFKNLYFMLVHTPNYAYLSGIRQNTTLADGLHTIAIGEILANNTFVDAALPIDKCYTVQIPIPRSVTEPADESAGLTSEEAEAQAPSACQLAPQKRWTEASGDARGLYQGVFFEGSNLTLRDSVTSDDSSYAMFTAASMGVYTVATRFAFNGGSLFFDGYLVTVYEITGVALSLLVLIACAAVAAWLLGTRMATYAGTPGAVADADFTYVERDVYGRGTAIDMMDAQDTGQTFS